MPQTSTYPCVYVLDGELQGIGVFNSSNNKVITSNGEIAYSSDSAPPDAIAVTPDNALAYFAYSDNSSSTPAYFLEAIDTLTNTLSSNVAPTRLSAQPYQIAISPDGSQAWVMETAPPSSVSLSNFIEVIDLQGSAAPNRIDAGANEQLISVAFSPDGVYAYVASDCLVGSATPHPCVHKYRANSNPAQLVSETRVAGGVFDSHAAIAVSSDGTYLIRSVSDIKERLGLAFINTVTNVETDAYAGTIGAASENGIAIAPSGKIFLAAPNLFSSQRQTNIFEFDLSSLSYVGTIAAGTDPNALTITADGNTVYVIADTVYAVDTGTGSVTATVDAATSPVGIAAMPSIEPGIVTQPADQTIEYGQTATLSAAASGTPPLAYQWYQGASGNTNTPVPNATGSSFTTPPLTVTTNYWVRVNNVVANGAAASRTAAVTVKPLTRPSITQQPGSTMVANGTPATLSVTATGTPPLSYQWYTGNSGNTANLVQGATESSLVVTPAVTTSYWVRVTNTAGQADSNTATVAVNSPPTCTLAMQGTETSKFMTNYTVRAAANCTDPQGSPTTVTVAWSDQRAVSTGSGPVFDPTHTYSSPSQTCNGGPALPCLYDIQVSAIDQLGLSVNLSYPTEVITASLIPPVFSGQSSTFTVYLASPSKHPPEQVQFVCTTATEPDGTVVQASSIGISCSSIPPVVTLSRAAVPVTLQVTTIGKAAAQIHRGTSQLLVALCLPGCIALLFVFRRRRIWVCVLFLCLSPFLEDCGGGFKVPPAQPSNATPAGNYQLTIVDQAVDPNEDGFVQLSLIVPIDVSETQ
ncbi:MAG TPA: immunoglobulin domain-containing protein [Terracidiphilus sp.]